MSKERIKELHAEMEQLTLDAGVGPGRYKELALRLDHKRPLSVQAIHNFLEDVYVTEYKEVHRIWTLPSMTPEVWHNYEMIFSAAEFEEIGLLKKARKALKRRYVEFFKKKKSTRSKDSESDNRDVIDKGMVRDADSR